MADEVVLLSSWFSPFGMRVQIALAEKGINYEFKEEDLRNKSPLLLQTNPIHKKVPVLIHNGKIICESLIAVEYIDEVWSDKSPLLPSDPYQRAYARFWADFIDAKMYQPGRKTWTTKGDEQEASKKEFLECFKLFEKQLGDKPYFNGDNFGFLDVAFIPLHCWFQVIETFGEFKLEEEFPKYFDWVKRCLQRESVSNTLPDQKKIYALACLRRKQFGLD
ncbi:hypothetical protein L6164_013242 [Bauhinia variegata]|uniref:Uncharacterized protein n=1 Tax=Bauhinia variegata TaxID=167791 RepID=A0ACB9PBG9_BAUVA|nr:hypothetical protein L6164_013242 [Bauhinia variegata]